jgi:type IV secretion system protein VirB9
MAGMNVVMGASFRVAKQVCAVGVVLAFALCGFAQQPKPAAGMPAITDTKHLPLQSALDRLAGTGAGPVVPSVSSARDGGTVVPSAPGKGGVPEPLPRAKVVELSMVEEKALALGEEQKHVDPQAAKGNDARVTFAFGAGLPTVITAPFHVSIVELEPGETLTGPPAIGDSIRWEIEPGTAGTGALTQPLVIIKPHAAGLDTNLVVMTNKRTYYLRLVSRENDYIARVGFSYKEDEQARWQEFVAEQRQEKTNREDAEVVTPMAGTALDRLNFNYVIKGGDKVFKPIRVMDDGEKTYITMPEAALHQDLPALVVVNPRLKGEKAEEIVNFRVKGNIYVVDRLFERAALIVGSGKSTDKVTIRRGNPTSEGEEEK